MKPRALALALGWWALVLAVAPFGREAVDALRARNLLVVIVSAALAAFAVSVLVGVGVALRRGALTRSQVLVVVPLVAAMVAGAQALGRPEERVHVVMYGVLGALVFSGLGGAPWSRLLFACLITAAVGWLDEGFQGLLPDRVYDLADVMLNAGSGVAGAGVLALAWAVRRGERS